MSLFSEKVAFVDEPYSWRVPIASALANGLTFGFAKSAGLLVIGMEEEGLHLESHIILITMGFNVCLMGLLSPLVNRLCQRLTSSVVATIGVLVCFVSLLLSSFWLTSYTFLFFIGLFLSIGFALCFSPPLLLNGICFERYRSRSAGVCFAGESLGCTISPILYTFLIDRYTVRGALLIISAIFCNLIAPAIILPTTVVRKSTDEVLVRQTLVCSSASEREQLDDERPDRASYLSHRPNIIKERFSVTISALIGYTISLMLISFAYFNQVTVYPLLSNSNGVTRSTLSWVIAVNGMVEFFSRLFFGFACERLSSLGKVVILAVFMGTLCIFSQLISFYSGNLPCLYVYVVALGLSGGCLGAMWTVIVTLLVGVMNSARCLSFILMAMSLFSFVLLCTMGYIREAIGSYSWVIRIGGFSAFLAMLVQCTTVIPAIRRQRSRAARDSGRIQDDNGDNQSLRMDD